MATEKRHRYPGPQPFSSADQDLFYGRAKAIRELYRLIQLEQLIVLYAKSGLGKSSLLNAGIVPKAIADKRLAPIDVRFHAWTEGSTETPLSITRRALVKELPKGSFFEKIFPDDGSLWHAAKRWQLANNTNQVPFLIMDQFEELFTYSEGAVQQFARAFGEMLAPGIPRRVELVTGLSIDAQPDMLTDEQEEQLYDPIDIKVVIAIRSDRLSLLDRLTTYVRDILKHRYELAPLRRPQAREAILQPSQKEGVFISPTFNYSDEALNLLLDFLTKNNTEHVESFQLQILCQAAEQRVINDRIATIEASHLGDPRVLFEEYYLRQIARLPEEMQLPARRFVEEGLIYEKEERRLSIDESQAMSRFGLTEALTRKLTATHLVRRQSSPLGGHTYELSHDTLVAPVLTAKLERTAAERRRKAEAERRRKEAEMAELKQQAEIERKRAEEQEALRKKAEASEKMAKRRTRLAWIFMAIASLLAALAAGFYLEAEQAKNTAIENEERAIQSEKLARQNEQLAKDKAAEAEVLRLDAVKQKEEVEKQKELALQQKREAENNLQKFLRAEAQREAAEFAQLKSDAKIYIEAEEWELAKGKLVDALLRQPRDKEANEMLGKCENELKK
ncbi:MAG: hypothetical protein AAFZ15_12865 [Bacteroidota bacterium]